MESNQNNMFNPTRYIAFLVLMVTGIVAFLSGKNSESDVYVPSDTIVRAIESGEDALKVCEDGRDSFYVYVDKLSNTITAPDIGLKNSIKLKFKSDYPRNLIALNDYANGMFEDDSETKSLCYSRLLKHYESSNDSILEIPIYNLSKHFFDLKNWDSCIRYSSALNENFSSNNEELKLKNKDQLRLAYKEELLFSESFEIVNEIIVLLEEQKEMDSFALAKVYYDKAALCFDLHEFDSAPENYNKSLELLPEGIWSDSISLNIYTDLALNQINSGSFKKADSTIMLLRGLNQSPLVQFRTKKLEGFYYYHKADDEKAVLSLQKAIELANDFDVDEFEWLDVQYTMIACLFYLEDYSQIKKVLSKVKDKYDFTDLSRISTNTLLQSIALSEIRLDAFLANEAKSTKGLEEVLERINNYINHIDYLRINASEEDANNLSQVFLRNYGMKYLVIFQLHELEPTKGYDIKLLQAVEKEKAIELFFNKFKKQNQQGERLDSLYRSSILEKDNQYNYQVTRRDSIQNISPLFADVAFGDGGFLLESAKNYCRNSNCTILEYIDSYNGNWVVRIDQEEIQVYELRNINSISNYNRTITILDSAEVFQKYNQKCYQDFFKEVEADISTENLIIISDGFVDDLAFGAFLSHKTNKYVIESFNISRAYSLKNLLINNSSFQWKKINNMIAYSYSDIETYKNSDPNGLVEIQGTYNECLSIKEILKDKMDLISGFQATKEHFIENVNKYDIIHLALHGSGNDKSIKQNQIYFRGSNKDELILNSSEVENLNLNASLLVLNACQTNSARGIVNQGNFSMARSFAKAGIDNLITSRLPINDNSSQQLITNFYKELSSDKSISKALTNSKRQYLEASSEERRHPFYWSSLNCYMN